jgi:LacI family transcriptional regulator
MKKLSIKDIAQKAGVSTATVSFVLNGKAEEMRISEQLAKKITKLAKQLGYQPNQLARGLRTGKTHTLGLIVENISNHFFGNLAKVIEDEAKKYNYKVLYCSTENNTLKAKELIQMLQDRQVDGYIITPTEGLEGEIEKLIAGKKPVVLVDRYFANLATNYVLVDNHKAVYDTVTRLVARGHQHIGVVTVDLALINMEQRLNGYKDALKAAKIPYKKELVKIISFDAPRETAMDLVAEFLGSDQPKDAVFFLTNYLGILGLECLKKLKLKVPEQVAFISFDDHDIFRLHTPSITALAQPVEDIGRMAMQILLEEIKSGMKNDAHHFLPGELVVRESAL